MDLYMWTTRCSWHWIFPRVKISSDTPIMRRLFCTVRKKSKNPRRNQSVDWTFDEDCDCKPMWKFAVKYDALELRYELRDYETQSESRSIPFATKVAKLEFLITFRIWTVKAACNFLAGSGFFFIWKINKYLLLIELIYW